MKHVEWSFQNLSIPMIDIDGTLYCTSQVLADALGVTIGDIRWLYSSRKDEFDGICVSTTNAINFLQENKHLFGVKYLRGDMRLWSENDMILMAVGARSDKGKAFRKNLVAFIKKHAVLSCVSQEKYDELATQVAELQGQVAKLVEIQPFLEAAASAAGKALQAQKGIKPLRNN